MDLKRECYEKAIEVLEKVSTPHGFYASGGIDGYDAVWSRDSMISSLGASLIGERFKRVFARSLITLGENQSKNGQIPNCVDKWSERKPHVDFKTIDSSLWFIIGHYIYKMRFNDSRLFNRYSMNIKKAFNWLACQDPGEVGMLAQLPTSDWQDAFPQRYGHTINTQALYYYALNLAGRKSEAEALKKLVNENQEDGLWNGSYYYAYRWKNHGQYKELSDWFDTLGNLLAIIFGLADSARAEKILEYIRKNKIAEPYPIRDIYPPIDKKSKHWQDYYLDCMAGVPNQYSNGGVWGFIGGFYVLALIKMKKFKEAEHALTKIAEADVKWGFPEWIHPITHTVLEKDKLQTWEAGSYLLAHESLKAKRVLLP
ncbi:MAG: glycoside hydrolase 100 family protein [Nanoarchaeota archaeon]|nr:glycoside hydrolase 100 family protein [Nanoarchaeota archaeon]MBU0977516.1 glycoside hydrolase 100 family protein [Nanoarchaeota archaeon]